jgi:hypothetical protein
VPSQPLKDGGCCNTFCALASSSARKILGRNPPMGGKAALGPRHELGHGALDDDVTTKSRVVVRLRHPVEADRPLVRLGEERPWSVASRKARVRHCRHCRRAGEEQEAPAPLAPPADPVLSSCKLHLERGLDGANPSRCRAFVRYAAGQRPTNRGERPSHGQYWADGGWGGIRTPGEPEPTPVFKTGALNHSATHPCFVFNCLPNRSLEQNPKLSTDCPQTPPITGPIKGRSVPFAFSSSPPRWRRPRHGRRA